MRTLPHLDAVRIPAEEIRRRGEPLEILRLKRGLCIRGGQLCEGIRPRPPRRCSLPGDTRRATTSPESRPRHPAMRAQLSQSVALPMKGGGPVRPRETLGMDDG